MTKERTDEGWQTATFQLDDDDGLEPQSEGAKAMSAHAEALKMSGNAISESIGRATGWGKNVEPVTLPIDMALARGVRCHCLGAFGQRCFACDPNGTMYALVRPGLTVRIFG